MCTQTVKAMTFVWRSVPLPRNLLPIVIGLITMVEPALGCSGIGEWSLPTELKSRLQSTVVAEDHLLAALLYQKQAQLTETEAVKYEDAARKIAPLEDPKNFRRSGFTIASQQCRKEAVDLQRLADNHRQKAETLQANRQAN